MNDNNYGKGNGQYNNQYGGLDEDYFDYGTNDGFDNNNYYQNQGNYTVPLDGDLSNSSSYSEKNNWSDFDQGRYGVKNNAYNTDDYYNNYNNYMNNEYNYYEDDYGYDDQYTVDYGSNNYQNNGYDYTEFVDTPYESNFDPSLYEISNKLNATVDDEILYSSLINQSDNSNNSFGRGGNSFDNVTVGINIDNYGSEKNIGSRYEKESLYNGDRYNSDRYDNRRFEGIDSHSDYYHRKGTYDNKLIPTQDIVFDDAYVVRNQLFEDEDKLFTFNDLISFLICIVFAVILAFLITRYVAQLTEVDGPSMSHNLQNKDDLLLDKFSYKVRKPKRYEIVVFPVNNDDFYIKRIIGLPGEKVDVQKAKIDTQGNIVSKSKVFIDGKELTDEIYGFQDIRIDGDNLHVTLGEDEYYVMGDNRNNSNDSRSSEVGSIKGADFVGRAIFRVFPLSSIGPIDSHINEKIYKGDEKLKRKYNVQ